MNFFIPLIIACMGVFFSARTERIDLESYVQNFDSIPIAICTFQSQDSVAKPLADQPSDILSSDLEFSGRFKVYRIQNCKNVFDLPKTVGIFLTGEYFTVQNEIFIDFYLRDASSLEMITTKKYRCELHELRSNVHQFSNHIFYVLFGEEAYFDSKILFVQDNSPNKNICISDYDGYSARRVFAKDMLSIFPCFVDSSSILFVSYLKGKPDIYRGSLAKGTYTPVITSRFVSTSPSVSLLLGRMAYASAQTGSLNIFTCDLNGENRKQITFTNTINTSPDWSPNGFQIAFCSDRSGQPQIYVMDSDGANCHRVTFVGNYQDSPSWSPRGDKIAYMSQQEGKFDIWTVKSDGTGAKRVTSQPGNNEYPTWSPDGSHIAFSSTKNGKSNIFCIRPDGTGLVQLTKTGNAKSPDWSRSH